MKRRKSSVVEDLRAEYRPADFPKGLARGKYAGRLEKGSQVVVLDPEIAAAFPTSSAVNEALGLLLQAARLSNRTGGRSKAGRRAGGRVSRR
jgi:hypothetical protein